MLLVTDKHVLLRILSLLPLIAFSYVEFFEQSVTAGNGVDRLFPVTKALGWRGEKGETKLLVVLGRHEVN